MIQSRWLVALLVSLLINRAADAQSVLRVGAGYHATIQAAIQAAAPGDRVLVDAGVYEAFTVGKPLTISAQPSAFVQILSLGVVSINLASFEICNLAGLDIDVQSMTISGGVCSAERCTIRTVTGLEVSNNLLALRWSSVWASHGSGLHLQNGHLHASEGTISTAAGSSANNVYAALDVDGVSTCSLSQCTLSGAWPNTAQEPDASVAIDVAGMQVSVERAWLLDCSLFGGFNTNGSVGTAIRAPAAPAPAPIRLHRPIILGAIEGEVGYGTVIGVRTSVDMNVGAPFTTTMTGDPGSYHLFYGGTRILGSFQTEHVEQPALGFFNTLIFGIVLSDAQGEADFTFVVPSDPAVRHAIVWWRGADILVYPWQATPAFATIVQ
ncbi:MAG: hypothetical protein ACI89X_003510 [Planctomycetota bacterium]|jgi:hypothetical protein